MQMLDVDYISLSAPSSHKTSLNGGKTIPMPRHIARHSRPTTGHYIGQSNRRGHEVISLCTAPGLWTCIGPTFYMTCKLEFDISIITEPVYYFNTGLYIQYRASTLIFVLCLVRILEGAERLDRPDTSSSYWGDSRPVYMSFCPRDSYRL